MNPVAEAKLLISKMDPARVFLEPQKILVQAGSADGFDVSLEQHGNAWLVAFDGWHEHFDSADDALRCFAFGLKGPCVLRVTYRGESAVEWCVINESAPEADSVTTSLLFSPFWRRKTVKLKRNRLGRNAL